MIRRKPIPPDAKMVFKGEIFEVWQWEQKMFDGTTAIFERLKRPDTAQIIALVGDKILIQTEDQPDAVTPFISIPGGRIDEGEDPLAGAKRELVEETGYASDDWTLWKEIDPVGKQDWTIYTYIARDCRSDREPHLDAGEKISSRLVSFEEFIALSDEPLFYSPELVTSFLRMRIDAAKKEEFRKMLFG
jgi:ADP-ribose diphosphatase